MKIDSPSGNCSSLPEEEREAVSWSQRIHLPGGGGGDGAGEQQKNKGPGLINGRQKALISPLQI